MGIEAILQRTPALAGATPACLARLSHAAEVSSFQRGEYLWRAGEPALHMTVLRNGLIKVVREGAQGRAAICGLFGPPESVGDVALIKGVPYPAHAIVLTDTVTVVKLPRELVLACMQDNPGFATSVTCGMWGKISQLQAKIDVLSAGNVEARLAALLLKLYEQLGDDFDDGTARVPVSLSRRELSELVSTSPETTIRAMSRWNRAGVLATDPTGFTIYDLRALRSVAS